MINSKNLFQWFIAAFIIWTVALVSFLYWDTSQMKAQTLKLASTEARAHVNKDKAFRLWATSHGGVYVPTSEHTPPNPRLSHIPDRDITTVSGKKLTLMNPAYILRQLLEDYEELIGVKGKITTFPDKLFYQENMPDEWELTALNSFVKGAKEAHEVTNIDGKPYFRLMRPLLIEKGCLKCHGSQGYQIGDIRGGIDVAIPMRPFLDIMNEELKSQYLSFAIIWLVSMLVLTIAWQRVRDNFTVREKHLHDIRESEEKYRSLFENMMNGFALHEIVLDKRGNPIDYIFLEVNKAFEMHTSLKREDIIGKKMTEVLPYVAEEKPGWIERYGRVALTGNEDRFEQYSETLGKWFSILAFSPKKETFATVFEDITERKKSALIREEHHQQIEMSLKTAVASIAKAVEVRDPYTAGHQQRVSKFTSAIAEEMGFDKNRIMGVQLGALVHDIGKIKIPAEILSKPGRLSDLEYEMIKEHARIGYDILKGIDSPSWPIAEIALQHHERMDGSGYPAGLKGDEICLEARIVAVADVLEAMSSHRPYRASLGADAALNELMKNRGNSYDPEVVDACLKLVAENKLELNE